jgi:hypothetical protein
MGCSESSNIAVQSPAAPVWLGPTQGDIQRSAILNVEFRYNTEGRMVKSFMQKTGCKQWGMIPGTRGTWCWIDEGTSTTGAVVTFLNRKALDDFVLQSPTISEGASGGKVNTIVE